jgi:hypothetical protein
VPFAEQEIGDMAVCRLDDQSVNVTDPVAVTRERGFVPLDTGLVLRGELLPNWPDTADAEAPNMPILPNPMKGICTKASGS